MGGGVHDGAAFNLGTAGRNANNDFGLKNIRPAHDFADKIAEHGFGDAEIGDDAVAHRPGGDDVAGGAAEHFLGLGADGDDYPIRFGDSDDSGLVENYTLAGDVDDGIGGAEIDAQTFE